MEVRKGVILPPGELRDRLDSFAATLQRTLSTTCQVELCIGGVNVSSHMVTGLSLPLSLCSVSPTCAKGASVQQWSMTNCEIVTAHIDLKVECDPNLCRAQCWHLVFHSALMVALVSCWTCTFKLKCWVLTNTSVLCLSIFKLDCSQSVTVSLTVRGYWQKRIFLSPLRYYLMHKYASIWKFNEFNKTRMTKLIDMQECTTFSSKEKEKKRKLWLNQNTKNCICIIILKQLHM